MLKQYFIYFGFISLFASPIYSDTTPNPTLPHSQYPFQPNQEITYGDRQNARRGNWDFKGNWRYNRNAFFRGETQAEAVEQAYLNRRPPGVGDPNDEYWQYYYQYYHRPFYDGTELNSRERNNF